MKKWKYLVLRTLSAHADEISVSINKLGAEGWEIASVLSLGGERTQFIFKQEVLTDGDSQENPA